MTDQQHPGEDTAYAWMTAPVHLKTRRQLRAAGLRPNGQDPQDMVVRQRRGRTLVARLFDTRLAAPKRTATPAQLDATRKATRERQLRAAERHGISRAELLAPDPGPTWAETTPEPQQGGNPTMSDRHDALPSYRHRDNDLDDHTRWPAATPVGRGQQVAYLYATSAVHQARRMRARIGEARRPGVQTTAAEAAAELTLAVEQAEQRMASIPWENPAALAGVLADGLAWHGVLDNARHTTGLITGALAREWGVVVDPEQLHVGIDPAIDAEAAQAAEETAALWRREIRAAQVAADRTSNPAVRSALDTWVGEVLTDDPRAHLADAPERRTALGAALDQAGITGPERASVEFAVDYLRGDITGVDLAAAPVEVDPGQEVRSQVPRLLRDWEYDRDNAAALTREITVMLPADQEKMREVGRAMVAGEQPDKQVWPGYADRAELTEQIGAYADDAAAMAGDADFLVTGNLADEERAHIGLDDDIAERIERMATQRDELVTAINADKGLADIEKTHALATLDDIDAGRVTSAAHLPELMWADERSRREVDIARVVDPAVDLADQLRDQVVEVVDRLGVSSGYQSEIERVTGSLAYAVQCVADGSSPDPDGGAGYYRDERTKLGHALTAAEVPVESKQEIRGVIDTAARRGRELGAAAAERAKTWASKIAAACAARDSAAQASRLAAEQDVVDLGRAQPPARACANRPAQTAHTATTRPRTAARAVEGEMSR